MLQTAGYQAIIHGPAGGYRSHVLAGGRWTVWHSTARQGAFPPLPHVDWRRGPTQAYYMSADPWPLAVLLHTVSAPNKRQEPGWVNPPTLVWSPDQEEPLQAAWQGDAIRATDVPDLHAGPITHARPAATLAPAQRGQQNPQWAVCVFSPADAHIVVCDPERLPGPEAVIRVADCTRLIIKALREGEHHALLLQVRLKDNARAARPGVWPTWSSSWRSRPQCTTGYRPSTTCDGGASPRCGGPGPHTGATHGATGQPALQTSGGGRHSEVGPLPPARGATEPTKCPLCADKYYTSGAMLEQLMWHAAHAAAPADDKEAAINILQGRARRSPWHAPYTRAPPAPGSRPRRRR